MDHIIAKPIKTARRKLAVNDPVNETDDLAPFTFADLKAREFITAKPDVKSEPAPVSFGKRPVAPSTSSAED